MSPRIHTAASGSILTGLPSRLKGFLFGYVGAALLASGRTPFRASPVIPMLAPALPQPRRVLPPARRGHSFDCE